MPGGVACGKPKGPAGKRGFDRHAILPMLHGSDSPAQRALRFDGDARARLRLTILKEEIPEELAPGRFLAAMVTRVLGATPVNMHKEARKRRASPELR